jgi:nucleotide-binding universal stress UspA family protein
MSMRLFARLGRSPRLDADHDEQEQETITHVSTATHQPAKVPPSGERAAASNVLVVLRADEMDDELVRLGCLMAKARQGRVFGIYSVEVPRTLPLAAPLLDVAEKAQRALERAVELAEGAQCELQPEIVQARHAGHSLVEEANAHSCGLIILGIPYRPDRSGRFALGETVPYVLSHAACRVWVIRSQQRST